MKLREAIERVDALKFNTYTYAEKVAWLSRLDERVEALVHGAYDRSPGALAGGPWYDAETDPDTELLIPSPFDEIYLRWLEAQIDYANGEYDKYNASIVLYNSAYTAYSDWYIRTHKPKQQGYWVM